MNKRNKVFQVIAIIICIIAMCGTSINYPIYLGDVEEEPVALSEGMGTLVSKTDADINVMPDKYNTGATGELREVGLAETINGIIFVSANKGTANGLDFARKNPSFSGTVTFENLDFSKYQLLTLHDDEVKKTIKVIFKNCVFSTVTTGKGKSSIIYEFDNCTFNKFNGSNTIFNDCAFGKSYSDGINPFTNVSVNNCFFSDMASDSEDGAGKHTDGTQIYGFEGLNASDIFYNNCRFEIPAIQTGPNSATINACIMLQMEYSNANNLEFNNCTVNGGGYTIFARSKNDYCSLTNIKFKNINIGCSMLFGPIYPNIAPGVQFNNIESTSNLYVGSVWKDRSSTHISVSNDTNQERELLVYADGKIYTYKIPACPIGNQLFTSYAQFPFDIDISIPDNCNYIVCYDSTIEGMTKQIRYENWVNKSVYLDKVTKNSIFGDINAANDVAYSGQCGANVTFTLTKSGILTLSGEGATYDYHSAKLPPWEDYKQLIKEIKVDSGVEVIGSQLFSKCTNVNEITLSDGVTTINKRAFYECSTLQKVVIPNSIESIGDYAFSGTLVQSTLYYGNSETWRAVTLGQSNDALNKNLVEISDEQTKVDTPLLDKGICGIDIRYRLTEDGVLYLEGEGSTYNYHSLRVAPWFEYKDIIKEVIIGEGITSIGQQLFRQCKVLKDVKLPDSLIEINNNAFIQCSSLQKITIPKSIKKIQQYAFNSTSLNSVLYEGNTSDWERVYVGKFNDKLIQSIKCIK